MKKLFITILLITASIYAQPNQPIYSSDFNTYIDTVKTRLDSLITLLNAEDFSSAENQDSIEVTLNAMQTYLISLDGKDYSTAANQSTIISLLSTIQSYVDQLENYLDGVEGSLALLNAKDFATETKLEAIRLLINSLDGKDYATQTTLAALLSAFNSEDFANSTNQNSIIDSLGNVIILLTNQLEEMQGSSGGVIINGTATNTWTQVSTQTCRSFTIKNHSDNELRIAFSATPGSNYDILYGKTGQKLKYNNTNVLFVYGNGNYKIITE